MSPLATTLFNVFHCFGGGRKRQKAQTPQIAVQTGPDQITQVTQRPSSSSSVQLEAWTLDQDLFRQVYKWNETHPDRLSDRFLNGIRGCIEQHKDLLEAIPDGPIPFRGFAKALTHIVKVGVTIVEAKTAALKFVEVILRWVEDMALHFEDSGSGPLVQQTWENLNEVRNLISEVCAWAHTILNDSMIARISANDQILQFQNKFKETTDRFVILGHINIAGGIDDLKASLPSKGELPDARYGSQNKNPCDPDTRMKILDDIMDWVNDVSDTSKCFFWLSGDPGIGKSAITASVARECMRHGTLWAQFFINRNDARTIDPKIFFPSIADQMSISIPTVKRAVQKAYKELPYLTNEGISKDQATKLFIDVIQVASRINPKLPGVIVIDALDETDAKHLNNTVHIFSQVVADLPPNAKVFISSRAETVILNSFSPLVDKPRVQHLHLSADSKDSIDEVTNFIRKKIRDVMEEYDLDEGDWGQDRIDLLCTRASGLFIWAVTAIEYIRNQIHDHGKECLRGLLDELTAENMADINNLYHTILAGTIQHRGKPKQGVNPWPLQRFKCIIGAIVVASEPLSIVGLEHLLDLRNPDGDLADIKHFVRQLRAVLVDGDAEVDRETKPRVHRSFSDFVTSGGAGEYQVNWTTANRDVANRCINQLKQLWKGEKPMQSHAVAYALRCWPSHIANEVMEVSMRSDMPGVHLVHVVLSPTRVNNTIAYSKTTQAVVKMAKKQNGDDLKTMQHLNCIAISVIRLSAVFVQDGFMHFQSLQNDSSPKLSWSLPTNDLVHSIDFSVNQDYVVSTAGNNIYVWSSDTGQIVLGPLQGHSKCVISAFFAPDGHHIVTASADTTIRIWDVTTGDTVSILEGHTDCVQSAVFSQDGRFIVSASCDKTIRVWDVETGVTVLGPLVGHHAWVRFATFTSSGTHILSYGFDHIILAWDLTTGELIPSTTSSRDMPPPQLTPVTVGPASLLTCSVHLDECGVAGGVIEVDKHGYSNIDHRDIICSTDVNDQFLVISMDSRCILLRVNVHT